MAENTAGQPNRASIRGLIRTLRGKNVLLDEDLAALLGVPTKALNRNAKRHEERFSPDTRFQLDEEEWAFLRYQTGTLKLKQGRHRKYLPYAFTEEGVAQLVGTLRRPEAVRTCLEILWTFVEIQERMASREEMAKVRKFMEQKYNKLIKDCHGGLAQLVGFGGPAAGFRADREDGED